MNKDCFTDKCRYIYIYIYILITYRSHLYNLCIAAEVEEELQRERILKELTAREESKDVLILMSVVNGVDRRFGDR